MGKKFAVPNWAQSILARAVGLDPGTVSVEHEDDQTIVFMQYEPHCSLLVGKAEGKVIKKEELYGNQRKRPVRRNEGCLQEAQHGL